MVDYMGDAGFWGVWHCRLRGYPRAVDGWVWLTVWVTEGFGVFGIVDYVGIP